MQVMTSTGPGGIRLKGFAPQIAAKYTSLARDAHASGDTVLAESYRQHAEHYRRVQPQTLAIENNAFR